MESDKRADVSPIGKKPTVAGKIVGYALRLVVSLVILAAAGYYLYYSMTREKTLAGKSSRREIERCLTACPVKKESTVLSLSGYGTVEPIADITISSEVSGAITYLNDKINVGELVDKDETLCRIEKTDYETNLRLSQEEKKRLQAEKAITQRLLEELEAEYRIVKKIAASEDRRFTRINRLSGKNVVSLDSYDEAIQRKFDKQKQLVSVEGSLARNKLELAKIEAEIAKSQAEINIARKNIARCEIKSPFKGRVNQVFVDVGEYMNVGEDLFEISDESRVRIPVSLDALDAANVLGILDKENIIPDYSNWLTAPSDAPVTITWTQCPGKCAYRGKLTRIKQYDKETRSIVFIVEPVFETQGSIPLISGMFCKVTFAGKTVNDIYRIPLTAIQRDNRIFVVKPNGLLESKSYKPVNLDNDSLIINAEINAKDLLITQRVPRGVTDGAKITPIIQPITEPLNSPKQAALPSASRTGAIN